MQVGIPQSANSGLKDSAALEEAIRLVEYLRKGITGGEQGKQLFLENSLAPYIEMFLLLTGVARCVAKGQDRCHQSYDRRRPRTRKATEKLNAQVFQENQRESPSTDRRRALEVQQQTARNALQAFRTELYAKYPDLKVRRGEVPMVTTDQLGTLLPDPSIAVLEYVITDERVYLFVLTRAGSTNSDKNSPVELKPYRLNVTPKELAVKVAEYDSRIRAHSNTFKAFGRELYDLLVKPAEQQILGKATLCIVPDGVLWQIPFQALQSPTRYLIEDYAVFYVQSMTSYMGSPRTPPRGTTKTDRKNKPANKQARASFTPKYKNSTTNLESPERPGLTLRLNNTLSTPAIITTPN